MQKWISGRICPIIEHTLPDWIEPPDQGMPQPTVEHNDDGSIRAVEYHNKKGKLNRKAGPARITWHKNGVKQSETWYHKDLLHRLGGPASEAWHSDGTKYHEEWQRMGRPHREGGAALIHWHENGNLRMQRWYYEGRSFNFGPTLIEYNEAGQVINRC